MAHPNFGPGAPPWDSGAMSGAGFFTVLSTDRHDLRVPTDRIERIERTQLAVQILKNGRVPNWPMERLVELLNDFKEEGNLLFAEKSYKDAAEHYTYGLSVGKSVENSYDVALDRSLLSTLFSNRAACYNKMDLFDRADNDCQFAISLKQDNVKAYYRKAFALKSLREYSKASKVAQEGLEHATKCGNTNKDFINTFKELIREIKSHVGQHEKSSGKKQPPTTTATCNIRKNVETHSKSGGKKHSKKVKQVNSQVNTAKSTTVSVKAKSSPISVDESWLEGTNALGNNSTTRSPIKGEKHKAGKASGNMKKEKPPAPISPPKTAYNGKFSSLQNDVISSEDDTGGSDSNSEQSDSEGSEVNGHVNKAPSSTSSAGQFYTEKCKKGKKQQSNTKLDGLDDFDTSLSYHIDLLADFSPIHSTQPVPPPFISKYDFTLVCASCYSYNGYGGPKGFLASPKLKHTCSSETLLIRDQVADMEWVKVRSRPVSQVDFFGKYKLCTQYTQGRPCRVTEERCSFAHSEQEIEIWEMERGGKISIAGFIKDQKKKLLLGQSVRLYGNVEPVAEERNANNSHSTVANPKPKPTESRTNHMPQTTTSSSKGKAAPPPGRKGKSAGGAASRAGGGGGLLPIHVGAGGGARPKQPTASKPVNPPPVVSNGARMTIPFPSEGSHNYCLVCETCVDELQIGLFDKNSRIHNCLEDRLIVQTKGEQKWVWIRERYNHRPFTGSYLLCRYQCGTTPKKCPIPKNTCRYAHNEIERRFWTLEKDGKFSVTEFILQSKSTQNRPAHAVGELFRKHPGQFVFLCKDCFYDSSLITGGSPGGVMCTTGQHVWADRRQLMHISESGPISGIASRPFQHKDAFFLLCNKMQYCVRIRASIDANRQGRCSFAHSIVERDVWLMERDSDITRDELVVQSDKLRACGSVDTQQQQPADMAPPSRQAKPSASQSSMSSSASSGASVSASVPRKPPCPHKLITICSICWKSSGKRSVKDGKSDRCNNKTPHSLWEKNKMYIIEANKLPLKPLPKTIPKANKFAICHHITQKKKCEYLQGGHCQFAHSQHEMDIWTYMLDTNLLTLEALMLSIMKPPEKKVTAPIAKGETLVKSVPTAQPSSKSVVLNPYMGLAMNGHYCHYCTVQCNSNKQWMDHCASEKHLFNVNTDKEHQWNYRQPTWNVNNGNYQLCADHNRGLCRYSEMPDMYNACPFAHSQQELDEWKERFEFRQMKRDIARRDHVFTYMETLQEEYNSTSNGFNVISDELDNVIVSSETPLSVFKQEKSPSIKWTFILTVKDSKPLEKVALLLDKDRLHFYLTDNEFKSCQIADASIYHSLDTRGRSVYTVDVSFTGGIFGSFTQWAIFDFGCRPVLVKKLNVELGTQFVQEKVQKLRENLHFDRWTGDNRDIIYFSQHSGEAVGSSNEMLKLYKTPSSADAVITQESVGTELNRHNYVHKMHKLLNLEELTQARIISRFNLEVELEVMNCIMEKTYIYPRKGELFAKVLLIDELSEDTDAGKLILSTVQRVLLAPIGANQVYEAIIVNKETFDYDGRGKDHIYLCISPRCCREMELMDGHNARVEMQFQMDRLPFCKMHHALDLIDNSELTGVVFPDVTQSIPAWHHHQSMQIRSNELNEQQLRIVQHVVSEREGLTLPLIIYGPFGTGKTMTLAQSAMVLLENRPDARILICTHSNSAADLYIINHMDAFIKKYPSVKVKLLRLYFSKRRINTVNRTVLNYCFFSPNEQSFAIPSSDTVRKFNVVITTLTTSLYLAQLHGHFTHIFIDEAAQALECETIMPLCLATPNTCVVMAGDHLQMTKKVYSREAVKQKFNKSLLERLFRHYEQYKFHAEGGMTPNILLSINYRNKMEILRFISAIFYGGPSCLVAESYQPEVNGAYPLAFHVALGHEVQDSDSTSYYNMAEIEEVTDRVENLYFNWPQEWGIFQPDHIGVVTPYTDQVSKIRMSLRRRRRELKGVIVERMMNMQGKEFRVVIISTVRTRHILDVPPRRSRNTSECDGDYGDYGFLSDPKLLNTAFTRAKSQVAVVGDPVALCAIGDCINIWRTFLKHCTKLGSILPPSVSVDTVRMQVLSLMNTPQGHNLIQLTAQPTAATPAAGADQNAGLPNPANCNGAVASGGAAFNLPNSNGADEETTRAIIEDWNLDYNIEADDIIRQLAKEELKNHPQPPLKTKNKLSADEPLKLECIHVKPEQGHAVMHYDLHAQAPKRSRRLLTSDDSAKPFDSDSDQSDDETMSGGKLVYCDYTPQQLIGLLRSDPTKYKRCVLHIENSRRMYAKPVDPDDSVPEVKLSSRLRCGRGFHNDEVVVELLSVDEEDAQALGGDVTGAVPQGEVKGVLNRAINPKYRMFVCLVEQGNTGLMVPLNRGIPKIYNVENTNRVRKTRKGHVCVYTFTKDREIIFHHYEPIDPGDTTKLFIVRYLKWDAKFYSPLGVVVGVIPAGDTVERGMRILDIEHSIPKQFRADTMDEAERLYPANYRFPESALWGRTSYRDQIVFTIDPSESRDLDDALSMQYNTVDSELIVGIHIADVSHFVPVGSALDREAETRGSAFYRMSQENVPMLPARLSHDLCSLLPGEDRLTTSVFVHLDMLAVVKRVEVKKCIIRSKFRLSYEDAEAILNDAEVNYPDVLKVNVKYMYRIAKMWREKRLGKVPSHYQQLDPDCSHTPKSHYLVEEMMIMANHQVANKLLEAFPTCTPLRVQPPPGESEIGEWRTQFANVAYNSVGLSGSFLPWGFKCECSGVCECVSEPFRQRSPRLDYITVHSELWEQILQWVTPQQFVATETERARSAILRPENHPQVAVALLALRSAQNRSSYVCSGAVHEEARGHHSIGTPAYTHFTSPIRRYIDIVVHRMLDACINRQGAAASNVIPRDVSIICARATAASIKVTKYEIAMQTLHLSSFLHQLPLLLNPVIKDFDDSGLNLKFPSLAALPPSCGKISFNNLAPSKIPEACDTGDILIRWHQRIYNLNRPHINANDVLKYHTGAPLSLNAHRFVSLIPVDKWRGLLKAAILDIKPNILQAIDEANQHTTRGHNIHVNVFSTDVTSEARNLRNEDHHVDFELKLSSSCVLQVQVVSELNKGLLTPSLQLLSITDTIDICMEHRKNPTRCFAAAVNNIAAKPYYKDVASYQRSWLPLVALEAAKGAICGDNSAVVHEVDIEWFEERQVTGDVYRGALRLPIDFCRERHIKFSCERVRDANAPDEQMDRDTSAAANNITFDFVCVRYKNVRATPPSNILMMEQFGLQVKPVHWVGHCITTAVSLDKATGMLTIYMTLHHSSVQFPRELLVQPRKATIEWIPKSLPDRRVENALKNLGKASPLAKDIATGKPTASDPELIHAARKVQYLPLPINPPNANQASAIQSCLCNPFTLIQGPPGTGKTVTGVRIAVSFTHINRNRIVDTKRQVLYCGPSNKSVDVVAHNLLKLGKACPKVVRVYSEMLEHYEFPLPLDLSSPRKRASLSDTAVDPLLRPLALHHLIRQEGRAHSEKIREFDGRVRQCPHDIDDAELQEYMSNVDQAQQDVLGEVDIILCTCSASAARRITRCNIKQMIVDEAGMCTEPETMVPIINSGATQVVLIGDHCQLRPIVLEDTSRTLGLERSLFERYSDKALMLKEQYRMHEAISTFPSQMFYKSQLLSASAEQAKMSSLKFWPNGRDKPIAFVHLVGCEVSQTVATADGSLMSKSNKEEASLAVRTAILLVRRFHVPPKDVVVLSQYRSQCAEIEGQLRQRGETDISVSTVVASQGSEWEYVILSTVRSLPKLEIEKNPTNGWRRRHLGFITDEHQINVAITRARKGLILLGNRYLLRCDQMWQRLLKHYDAQKKVVNANEFMT